MRTRAVTLSLVVSVAFCTSLAGCSSTPSPAAAPLPLNLPNTRPADFTLAATVYSPDVPSLPRSLRPARYILGADGALRAASGAPASEETFPPIRAQLTPTQIDELWQLVRGSDLLNPSHPARVRNPQAIPASFDAPTALLWISIADAATTLQVPLDRSGDAGLPAEQIVDRLAAWSRAR